MACLNNLKQDIKTLESLFPKGHEVFQITAASVDELTCRFINRNGKKFDIHANITVSIVDFDLCHFSVWKIDCFKESLKVINFIVNVIFCKYV